MPKFQTVENNTINVRALIEFLQPSEPENVYSAIRLIELKFLILSGRKIASF